MKKNYAIAELIRAQYSHLYYEDYEKAGLKTQIKGNWFYVIGDKDKIYKIAKSQGFEDVVFLSEYGIKTMFPELES